MRYNRRPPKLLQTESSFMHGSLLLGMFVASILRVSIVLSLLSLTQLEDNDVFIVRIEFM